MDDILTRLATIDGLPSLPSAALAILELADSDQPSVENFTAAIQREAALSAALIRTANRTLNNSQQPISNVSQALTTIGLEDAIPLVVDLSLRGLRETFHSSLDFENYWRRALLASNISGWLSRFTDISRENALLAGLVQDIGLLAASQLYGKDCEQRYASTWHGHPVMNEEEEKLFGYNHTVISAELLEQWHFPPQVIHAVRRSHSDPDILNRDLTWCVASSNRVTNAVMKGLESGLLVEEISKILESYWLPIAPNQYDHHLLGCLELISSLEQFFESRWGSGDIEQVLTRHGMLANKTLQ